MGWDTCPDVMATSKNKIRLTTVTLRCLSYCAFRRGTACTRPLLTAQWKATKMEEVQEMILRVDPTPLGECLLVHRYDCGSITEG